tara:strand:- start:1671 stop:1952 length:282 start_codon:yes stop_codon:yes gene_type:complete
MPANPKHLEKSSWQRFAKISAGILGGFLMTALFHLLIAKWSSHQKTVLITYDYTLFLVWIPLLLLPFFFDNGWKCWLWYAVIILMFSMLFFIG